MSLACMRITNHFHPNHFALKQRLGATRKWPINLVHLYSELVVNKALVLIPSFCVNYVFLLLKHCYVRRLENSRVCFVVIGFAKTRRSSVRFSRNARTSHALIVPVSLPVFTRSLQTFRLTARALLTSAKIRAVLPSDTYVAIDKIITEYVK